jgi:hypothetical protein
MCWSKGNNNDYTYNNDHTSNEQLPPRVGRGRVRLENVSNVTDSFVHVMQHTVDIKRP